jgi:stearoyl-CoA desaturase (delta-9 desaturase)
MNFIRDYLAMKRDLHERGVQDYFPGLKGVGVVGLFIIPIVIYGVYLPEYYNTGLLALPWWGLVLVTLLMANTSIMGVTIYLHRAVAHRALTLSSGVAHFFRSWLWFSTGMLTKQWVAVHRKHHATVETKDDPHSPMVWGKLGIQFMGSEVYGLSAKDPAVLERYGALTPNDWLERNVFTRFKPAGVYITAIALIILFGVPGIVMWAVLMAWIPVLAAGGINGGGHWFGYRNYNTPDTSTNMTRRGILIGGEELHNNHHAFASSAKFSVRSDEFDIGWMYIRILEFFGLAKVKRLPTRLLEVESDANITRTTVETIMKGKCEFIRMFREQVLERLLSSYVEDREGPGKRKTVRAYTAILLASRLDLLSSEEQKLRDTLLKQCIVVSDRFSNTPRSVRIADLCIGLQSIFAERKASYDSVIKKVGAWRTMLLESRVQVCVDFALQLPRMRAVEAA